MIAFPPCANCLHYRGNGTCTAFPSRIPTSILRYGHSHDSLLGYEAEPVTFTLKPGSEAKEAARRRLIAMNSGDDR